MVLTRTQTQTGKNMITPHIKRDACGVVGTVPKKYKNAKTTRSLRVRAKGRPHINKIITRRKEKRNEGAGSGVDPPIYKI